MTRETCALSQLKYDRLPRRLESSLIRLPRLELSSNRIDPLHDSLDFFSTSLPLPLPLPLLLPPPILTLNFADSRMSLSLDAWWTPRRSGS